MIQVFEDLKVFFHNGEWYVGITPVIAVEGPFETETQAYEVLKEQKSGASSVADELRDEAHRNQPLT